MGKVQSTFINTYPGAISRSVDDIVISLTNGGAAAIKFGAPVFLDTSTKVARNWASGDAVTGFIGIATRIGIKTPDTYASSEAEYAVNDIMSVIVRGSVCVQLKTGATAPKIGDKVYLDASTGEFTTSSSDNTELTNCKFRGLVGSNGVAEIVITDRNIQ